MADALEVLEQTPCGEKTKTSRWPSEIRTRNFRSKRLQNDAWLPLAAHLDNLGSTLGTKRQAMMKLSWADFNSSTS